MLFKAGFCGGLYELASVVHAGMVGLFQLCFAGVFVVCSPWSLWPCDFSFWYLVILFLEGFLYLPAYFLFSAYLNVCISLSFGLFFHLFFLMLCVHIFLKNYFSLKYYAISLPSSLSNPLFLPCSLKIMVYFMVFNYTIYICIYI